MSTTATTVPDFARALAPEHRAHPERVWAQLRAEPVHRDQDGRWIVSGWAEIRALMPDPRLSSDGGLDFDHPDAGGCPVSQRDPGTGSRAVTDEDAPVHARVRGALMRHFGPPRHPGLVAGLRAFNEDLVRRQLDGLRGRTRMDVVDDYTYPVPVAMICHVLGLPARDADRFGGWMHAIIGFFGDPEPTEQMARDSAAASQQMGAYLTERLLALRADPGEDMISGLAAEASGSGLTDAEVVTQLFALFTGGHDTTVNTTATTILELLRRPDLYEQVRSGPEHLPALFEEVLRLQPPIQYLQNRTALADIEVGGTVIPRGGRVVLVFGAANRDPRRFPDPDTLLLDRPDNQHLGFGNGPHYCFGAPMARLEHEVMVGEWLRRVRNPRLVQDPPPYRPSPQLRGPLHLLVDFDEIDD